MFQDYQADDLYNLITKKFNKKKVHRWRRKEDSWITKRRLNEQKQKQKKNITWDNPNKNRKPVSRNLTNDSTQHQSNKLFYKKTERKGTDYGNEELTDLENPWS